MFNFPVVVRLPTSITSLCSNIHIRYPLLHAVVSYYSAFLFNNSKTLLLVLMSMPLQFLTSLLKSLHWLKWTRVMYLWMRVDGRVIDLQYSNWTSNAQLFTNDSCVLVTQFNDWLTYNCSKPQRYVCQSQQIVIIYIILRKLRYIINNETHSSCVFVQKCS